MSSTGVRCIVMAMLSVVVIQASADDVKRGLGGANSNGDSPGVISGLNTRWYYNWGVAKNGGVGNREFVPMLWGGNASTLDSRIDTILGYGDTQYVLGFNEPERADQANMTVATAIDRWTTIHNRFDGTGIKLVSPAPSDTAAGRAWLQDFMTQAEGLGLRVDEVAFHWYGTVSVTNPTSSANSFLSKVDQYHTTYNRPVWITEFAGIDWGGVYTTEQMNTANSLFLQTVIAGLESRSYVTRYGWWNWNDDSKLMAQDAYGIWKPTIIGDNYIPTLNAATTTNLAGVARSTDTFYLRGGSVLNNGAMLGNNAMAALYAMGHEDGATVVASSVGGDSDLGQTGGYVRVESNAELRKTGSGTLTWHNVRLVNDGQIRLFTDGSNPSAGTVVISGNQTTFEGTGSIRLDPNSTLQIGAPSDSQGFSVPWQIIGAGGSLTKAGTGTLALTGNNTYSGNTVVVGGTLSLGGAGSIANSATITITVGSTLNVTGLIGSFTLDSAQALAGGGTILATGKTVIANGTLAPGSSPGELTQDGGVLQLGADANVNWQLVDADGVAGSGYDTVSLTNGATLDLTLLSAADPYNINLWSLSGTSPDANGDAIHFDNTSSYSWTLFSTGSVISGFDASLFQVNVGPINGTSGFSNGLGGGVFGVELSNDTTDIVLSFTPVPEPGNLWIVGAVFAGLALLRRKVASVS